MRIAVYTVALNEQQFVERWAETVSDADYAFVADTGSTDNTVEKLMDFGVTVSEIAVRPWRFDDARNAALALLPSDIDVVVALDMDETLAPNWRTNLEASWKGNRLRYGYVWSWTESGEANLTFLSDKIAGRFTHRWKHPVHECLMPTVPEVICTCHEVLIEHRADPSKSRGQYLNLLKLAVTEDPMDDRSAHYLGREYVFHRQFEAAAKELNRHLALPRATWVCERARSMRYLAQCAEALGDPATAYQWYTKATLEDQTSREPLIDLAKFCLARNQFYATIDLCERALAMAPSIGSYMGERYANNEGPYDLSSVAHFHIGQHDKALELATEAVRRNPDDPRLHDNLRMMGGS